MKLICEKEKLLLGLNHVIRSSVGRTTNPILEGVLITLKNNEVTLTTNDLEIGMEYVIKNVEIVEEGKTVVDSKMFSDIIRKLPDTDITISINNKNLLLIECEDSQYKLSTMNADDFPTLPTINVEKSISLPQKTFKDMIKRTSFAVSMDENRPVFTGCLLDVKKNSLNMVAIDGFRLAQRVAPVFSDSEDFKAIVPGKYLNEVSKNLMEINDHIKIGISKNQALFEISDCKIVTRLLEGDFLDYNKVIPSDKETRITISKSDLQGAIERASIFSISSQEKEKKYPIKLNINLDNVIISCTSQIGDAKEEVNINTEGKELEIGFNPKYLLDTLKAIEDDEVCLDFGSNISPCVIRPITDEKFTYMVLPMRL
ncbi:MAG: DNA polymerase III subunit beta [Clostridia bacterium]|nr:DNA polymerase III subunit beta [Clostridia bacterium]